ncbi:MAG: DUF87 domain-containing protein [Syntrophobacteraceae bacterium]
MLEALINPNEILKDDFLPRLIQQDNFIGWVYNLDYDKCLVMTNDLWKANAAGVPHNCFLLAGSFDPQKFGDSTIAEREVMLLRVVGSHKLPQDDELVKMKVDFLQQKKGMFDNQEYDEITQNQIQFGALECRVLGTFYVKDGGLWLGSDLESFSSAAKLLVYRPRGDSLSLIVNYVDPIRRQKAKEDAEALGITAEIEPFRIGTVRYTSTDRLQRSRSDDIVPVFIQPTDFLARRTAVLGMTRTGKSNMVKQTVSVVKRISDRCGCPIGQLIYDPNGEYSNPNQQDRGAISEIYPNQTVRYRLLQTAGFLDLRNNFYGQLQEGYDTIIQLMRANNKIGAQPDVSNFAAGIDFSRPTLANEIRRWEVKAALYQALLARAGFAQPPNYRVTFRPSQNIIDAINAKFLANGQQTQLDPRNGLNLNDALDWFVTARSVNDSAPLVSSSGNPWFDEESLAMLRMLTQRNANGAFFNGYRVIQDALRYHTPQRSQDVYREVYDALISGKIVIIDLSVGPPDLKERISKDVAQYVFNRSMNTFTEGQFPPNIIIYIEEAHNLIGKNAEVTDTWPRIAKEGAKYRIALVYSTQEVSSVHPSILSATENWFITHLNNEREINELTRFYDFKDFARSLIRAQDIGFARTKTLSGPYVIPVQIDKFDPEMERRRLQEENASQTEE